MEQKPKKTGAIIATVITSLLCGCVALVACGFGIAGVAQVPFTTTDVYGYTSQQPMAIWLGILLLCMSVIFIAVPVVVGVLTLRNKKAKDAPVEIPPSEPLPPAN